MTCTATEDDVDVFMSGYVFRLKIWHERGLSLLKREGKNSEFLNIHLPIKKNIYTGLLVRLL